jgi:hypothetical protein
VGLQRAAGPSRLDGGCELDRPRRHPKGEERDVGRKQAEWGRRAGPRGGGGGERLGPPRGPDEHPYVGRAACAGRPSAAAQEWARG